MTTMSIKKGLNSSRSNQVFRLGELVYTTDTKEVFIGDGEQPGGISCKKVPQISSQPDNCIQLLVDGLYVWGSSLPLEEKFVITVNIPANSLDIIIPTTGVNAAEIINYNWNIDWGDRVTEIKSGITSTTSAGITHNYTTAGQYQIIIRPVVNDYGWMRAWCFKSPSDISVVHKLPNKQKIISFDYVTNKSFMMSEISYGDYYMNGMCRDTSNIVQPANEVQIVSENLISQTGNYFRSYQYSGCTSLTAPAAEVLSNSITSIGNNFRNYQYSGCTSLTTLVKEVLSNSVTSIGNNFRSYQYNGCPSLTTPAAEVLSDSVISIGSGFRSYQYRACNLLTISASEVLPDDAPNVGDGFRSNQYNNCPNILINNHIHTHHFSILLNENNGNYSQMFYLSSLKSSPPDAMPRYYLDNTNTTTAPVTNLTPAYDKNYCFNRTNILNYASLHDNWK